MTQYLTENETVRHERLLDALKVRAAFDTPLLSNLPHETTDHIITEWPIDAPFAAGDAVRNIAAPHADSKVEGDTYEYEEPTYETRLRTIAEIKTHTLEMSGSDRSARIAGVDDPWDYRTGKELTKHFNSIDNTLMYGVGSPETGGSTTARKTAGLIFSSAITGTERCHGTTGLNNIQDSYGITIPSQYWSVFCDFDATTITMESFYNRLIAPAARAGSNLSANWTFMCGYNTMQRVSRFLVADGGLMLNERQRNADDSMGNDFLNTFRLASGHVVTFRTNRWLDDTDDSFTVDNTDFTPLTETSPGSQNRTFYGDQTIIGYEPGCARVLWYREPAFRDVDTNGDFSRLAITSEFAFMLDHPLCAIGAGNVLS